MKSASIILDSRPEETHRLLDWLDSIMAHRRIEAIAAFNLRCAIVELVNNSIVHAYGGVAGYPVEVQLEFRADRVLAEVRDIGPPFSGPPAAETDDLFSESGRGYEIIRAWVDRMEFSRLGQRNICRIEKSVDHLAPTH